MIRIVLLVASAFFLLAVLGGRFAAPAMGDAGLKIFPWSYDAAKIRLVRGQVSSDGEGIEQIDLARQQLSWAPATSDPLVFGALTAKSDDKTVDRLALALEARRRNPRSDLAHAWLMQYYLQQRELDKALESVGRLIRLRPQARDQINQLLVALVTDDDGWRSIAAAAAQDPEWRNSLVSVLLKRDDARSELLIVRLLSPVDVRGDSSDRLKRSYVQKLVNRRDYAEAFTAWKRFFATRVSNPDRLIRNATLQELDVPPPFNWRIYTGPASTVEYRDDGGIALRYSGRTEVALLSQMLLLNPGNYRLSFVIRSDNSSSMPGIGYRIACDRQKTVLVAEELEDVSSVPKRINAQFTVPNEKCPAQNIQLLGLATGTSVPIDARLESILIQRVEP